MNWKNYMNDEDLKNTDFNALVTVTDDVLDDENWPVHTIIVKDGVVVKQVPVYVNNNVVYELPSMVGWTTLELKQWLDLNDDFINSHPAVEHSISYIKED